MLILVVLQSIVVPVRIAFEQETPFEWMVADYIMDALFMVDIVVNFITVIESDNGDLVTNRKIIACTYLKGWFLIDFVSCAPVELIFIAFNVGGETGNKTGTASRFVKLAKLPRIYRILRVMKMIKIFKSSKAI